MTSTIVVLGIGNLERGDDGAGRVTARLLRHMLAGRAEVYELDGEATAILAKIEDASAVFMIDASRLQAPPGTVHRIDAAQGPLPQSRSDLSSHGFGVAAAIELGRTLARLPSAVIVYAIEGECFEVGAPLSPAVSTATTIVADRIRCEIEEMDASSPPCTRRRR
ncbi:MAG: hydrogenase maturation protease [Alphaproteobacteria bacterium]|nr:hydrogenase maturation protease [Alphaproteobacteria bacterium]